MLAWFANRAEARRSSRALYAAIVAQSRLPAFYQALAVPDTVTGRFEMIVVHMFLVLERLAAGKESSRLSQLLAEAFMGDMDSALREMGVGDLTVPRKMHAAAGAYFGRLEAYRKALAADDPDALPAALRRNAYADAALGASAIAPERLADYMRRAAATLGAQSLDEIAAGRPSFPPVLMERPEGR
jgi:cytochrome b pre-mRNA-processing protein 3